MANPAEGQEPAEQDPATAPEGSEEQSPTDGSQEPESTTTEPAEGESEAGKGDDLPDDHWARKKISELNDENARRRTENKELKEQLANAKSAEDVQKIVDEYTEKVAKADHALDKVNAGRAHGLPDELVELLQGETYDELLAHAEKLAPFKPAAAPRSPAPLPPSGGRNPKEGSDEESGEQLWAKIQKRTARRL